MPSRSLNKVTLIGNLTRDPELKYTPNGTAVCTFGIATNRSWTTAEGQIKEDVQYHRIVAWQKLAELCSKLLNKGKRVYLEGRLIYRTFIGKDNQERNITEIVLDDFIVFNNGKKQAVAEPLEETSPPETEGDQTENIADKKKAEEKPVDEDVNADDIPF